MRIARLEQEIADLRRRLTGGGGTGNVGQGVQNLYGQQVIRPVQVGFEAELTGPWNPATGYPWKRLRLNTAAAPPAFASPDIQPTGQFAIAANDDQTLGAGQRGWMEPAPDGTGYIFVAGVTGASGSGAGRTRPMVSNVCVIYGSVASGSGAGSGIAPGSGATGSGVA